MGGWLQFAMRPDALMGRTDMDGHLFFQRRGWEKSIFGVFASVATRLECLRSLWLAM